jgi:hypothetical protein
MCLLLVTGLLIGNLAQAVYEPSQLSDPSRRWAVDMGISGGYDDNVNSASANKQSSSTMALNPRLFLNIPLDQTFVGLRYSYNWINYPDRVGGDKYDQNHNGDLIFSHRFNPRLQLDLTDNFRRGISPQLTTFTGAILQFEGNYYFNNLTGTLTYNLTRLWTLSINTAWQFWSYDNASNAQQDRNIYTPGFNLNYLLNPATTLGLGFNVGIVDYNNPGPNNQLNSTTETAYLFLSHLFNPQLSAQVSAGGSVTELGDGHTASSPYATGSFTYRYSRNGTVSIGGSYFTYTSDLNGYRNSDAMAAFLQCSHMITPKLTGRLLLNFTHYEMHNPDFNTIASAIPDPASDSWLVNLGATYAFTRWLYGEAYYQFTHSSSNLGGSFDRNQIWGGIRVTY